MCSPSQNSSYELVRTRTFSYEIPSPRFCNILILRYFRSYGRAVVRGGQIPRASLGPEDNQGLAPSIYDQASHRSAVYRLEYRCQGQRVGTHFELRWRSGHVSICDKTDSPWLDASIADEKIIPRRGRVLSAAAS